MQMHLTLQESGTLYMSLCRLCGIRDAELLFLLTNSLDREEGGTIWAKMCIMQ